MRIQRRLFGRLPEIEVVLADTHQRESWRQIAT